MSTPVADRNTPGNVSPPPTYDAEREQLETSPRENSWDILFSQPLDGMKATSIVEYKTRLEPLTRRMAPAMYAPIIYQMHLTVKLVPTNPALLLNPQFMAKWNAVEFIMANARVVNGDNVKEEITKQGKSIMSGNLNVALTKQKSSNEFVFFGHTKIQFQDCSYHHNRIPFKLEWSFFLPNELVTPILSVISASFRVYARKPNKKRKDPESDSDMQEQTTNSLKRKRSDNEKYYELHLTKRGQQDGGAVPQVDLTSESNDSSPVNTYLPIEAQPLKKRFKAGDEENSAKQNNPQRERDQNTIVSHPENEEKEFQERLAKLLECVKSRKNMSCVQVVISSMMNVASEMYREAHIN